MKKAEAVGQEARIVHLLYGLAKKVVVKVGGKKYDLGPIYNRLWNPINYLIIAGLGVLINYVVQFVIIQVTGWIISNGVAILAAWLWNWSNSVGPWGYHWGFADKRKK